MPKEIPEFDPHMFTPFPTERSARDARRVRLPQEVPAIRNGELSEFVHPIDVWYLNGELSWSSDQAKDQTTPFREALEAYNDTIQDDERHITFATLSAKDFSHALENAFGDPRRSTMIPDLVVLDRSRDNNDYSLPPDEAPLANAYCKHYLQPIDQIRSAATTYYQRFRHNDLPECIFTKNMEIDEALVDHVFRPPAIYSPEEATEKDAIGQAFYELVDDPEYTHLLEAVRDYVEEDTFVPVELFLTDARL